MYKLKVYEKGKWHWLKGNLYHIELTDDESEASFFSENEFHWFKIMYLTSPLSLDYEQLF